MQALVAFGAVALSAALALTGVWDAARPSRTSALDMITGRAVTLDGRPDAARHVAESPKREIPDTVTASAASPDAERMPLTVLLMGDSYTAGNGARAGSSTAYYGPDRCMRSAATWGEQYADALEETGYAVTLMNRACSAATASSVIHDRDMLDARVVTYPEPEAADAPQTDEFYTSWAVTTPRCTPTPASEEYFVTRVQRMLRDDGAADVAVVCERWLAPQVDALNRDVDLVLLTLGGNDALFPNLVRQCLILGDAHGCGGAMETALSYVTNHYADDLMEVLTEIDARTEGHAKVAYLAYPGLEVNDDLRLSKVDASGVAVYPLAQQLLELEAAGLDAQRVAVEAVNDSLGADTVTLVDEIVSLFDGHEPDARSTVVNPERWMYEFLETTRRDEWYHLNPEGQRQIAMLMARKGVFGAADDNGSARDIALVVGDDPTARDAAESALSEAAAAKASVWSGARVSVIEQRLADDGVHLVRRVVAEGVDPDVALAALRAPRTNAWLPASQVSLPARWNGAAQTVYIGELALADSGVARIWVGDAEHREVTVDTRLVASTGTDAPRRLIDALASASGAPRAWAGGPYVASQGDLELSANGSVGAGPLNYTWDLDGDGTFETVTEGEKLTVGAGEVSPGWVAVRVATATGEASVAWALIAASPAAIEDATPCVGQDGVVVERGASGRQNCAPAPVFLVGSEAGDKAPVSMPLHSRSGVAKADAVIAIMVMPLHADERVVHSRSARLRVATRAGSAARRRLRVLVRRERGLATLLTPRSEAPRRSSRGVCLATERPLPHADAVRGW